MGVPQEIPLTITYNGRQVTQMMCTPVHLKQLVLGWLYSQGLVKSLAELQSIGVCGDLRQATIVATPDRWEEMEGWRQVLTSGCGGGTVLARQLHLGIPVVTAPGKWKLEFLQRQMGTALRRAPLYRETGGLHGAALVGPQGLVAMGEDIGRHNACDKVIGQGILLGIPFREHALLTTGRISSEMVMKAAQAGIPLLCSLSVTTDFAVEIGEKCGVTIVGRLCSRQPRIYSRGERIV
ncbi:MAG: formate dehydrogenase accessory sulfurtransferase FdhD [Limnochordia bacterium]